MTQPTPEQTAIIDRLDYVINELSTWALVHAEISKAQAGHTALLLKILEAVQPKPVGDDDGGVIGDLLRQIFAALQEHQATLNRVDQRLAGATIE
jgi:hypothetical protein